MPYDRSKDASNLTAAVAFPAKRAAVITPGASDFAEYAKALMVVAAGSVTYLPSGNDDADTIGPYDYEAGAIIPVQTRRVTAATATVLALYE